MKKLALIGGAVAATASLPAQAETIVSLHGLIHSVGAVLSVEPATGAAGLALIVAAVAYRVKKTG